MSLLSFRSGLSAASIKGGHQGFLATLRLIRDRRASLLPQTELDLLHLRVKRRRFPSGHRTRRARSDG